MERDLVKELAVWLKDQAKEDRFPRTHDLHLTDWEVHWLLERLETPRPLSTDYRWGGVGSTDRKDAPVPNGWQKGR